jgi:hypothetical protein
MVSHAVIVSPNKTIPWNYLNLLVCSWPSKYEILRLRLTSMQSEMAGIAALIVLHSPALHDSSLGVDG